MTEQQDEEATVVRPRRDAIVPESTAAMPVDAAGDLEDTVIRLVEPRPPAARAPLPTDPAPPPVFDRATAPSGPDVSGWAVRVRGTNTVVPLDRAVVVGRRPAVAGPGGHPEPRRLVVPADCADVSARHARIEQLGETLVVTDLQSTNGIVVHWSNGAPRRLRPGESTAVLPDAAIELGERLVLDFVPATPDEPPTPELPS